jgi:hypothetical protein
MAQNQIFKSAPAVVLVAGLKVGNSTSADLTGRTNSSKTPADGGLVISKGFKMGDVSIATIETVDGQSSRLLRSIRDNEVIQVMFSSGGDTVVVTGTWDEFTRKSVVDRGTTDGSYKMSGALSFL